MEYYPNRDLLGQSIIPEVILNRKTCPIKEDMFHIKIDDENEREQNDFNFGMSLLCNKIKTKIKI